MMRDNKGQVLILFVLLLPIILGICMLVIDVGTIYIEKTKIKNIISETIGYGLDNMDDERIIDKLNNLIDVNINDSTNNVSISNGIININVSKTVNGILIHDTINFNYYGYVDNNKKLIMKR